MNWSPTSRRPIYPNRTNRNNIVLHILRSKPHNNKTMRYNNRLIVKKLQNKPNVLKTLRKKVLFYNNNYNYYNYTYNSVTELIF